MIRVPDYYNDFSCVGGRCKDNCCIGWEIQIDAETMKRYTKITGALGKQLQENIEKENGYRFRMKENGRCPFLNEENLCDIIQQLGEEGLCEICKKHPRFMETYGEVTEIGVGLSCLTAAELIIKGETSVVLQGEVSNYRDERLAFAERTRQMLFQILGQSEKNIKQKIELLYACGKYVQEISNQETWTMPLSLENVKVEELNSSQMIDLLYCYEDISPMSREWSIWMERGKKYQDDLFQKIENETEVIRLLHYFLYRYYMKDWREGIFFEHVKFAIVSTLVIETLKQANGISRVESAHIYSKEIEYSDDNLFLIREELLFDPW